MQRQSRGPVFLAVSFLLSLGALASAALTWLPFLLGSDYIPTPWLVLAVLPVLLPPPSLVLGILAIRANRYEASDKATLVLSWGAAILAGVLTITCTLFVGLGFVISFAINSMLNYSEFVR